MRFFFAILGVNECNEIFRQLAALIVKFRPVFTLYALVDGSKSSSFEPVCKLAVTARCVVKELFFLVSVLAVIATLHCQAWSQSQTEMIIAAEREWAKAAVDRDVATFAKYMSDDYVLIAVDVTAGRQQQFEVTTKASWVEKIRSGREKYDSVEIHDLKVFFNGELPTVTGHIRRKEPVTVKTSCKRSLCGYLGKTEWAVADN